MKRHYETPTQVRWFDSVNNRWIGGIAYKNEVICGCCGGVFELDSFEEDEVEESDELEDDEEEDDDESRGLRPHT